MTRSGHIFYFLLAIHLVGFIQQTWAQQFDTDPYAVDFDLHTTVSTTNAADIILDDNEQQLSDTDLLEQVVDDDNDDDEDEGVDDDDDYGTNYDNDDTSPMDNYFGPLGQGDSKEQEQGDELGEEVLVQYDDEDDENDIFGNGDTHDGLMFEDDEEPLDFKNDEQMDLDQLLFDASQKDTTTNMEYDYQQQQQQDDDTITNDAIDEILSNADDALIVDPLDETPADTEHPDHGIQEQQQQQQPPNDDDDILPPSNNNIDKSPFAAENQSSQGSSTRYKLPLFGVLALLIVLYKVSNKRQGGRTKWIEKEQNGLPLHSKDLKIPDIAVDCPTLTAQPSLTNSHHQIGRRASSSSFCNPRQNPNSGNGNTSPGGGGGHARKISLGHHPAIGSQAKYRQ